MAKKTAVWKLWLRRNLLTTDVENDYTAEVSSAGDTLRNSDIADRIVAARSELRPETVLSILTIRDEIARDALVQGSAVQDGCVRISPKVSGSWIGVSHTFDPATSEARCGERRARGVRGRARLRGCTAMLPETRRDWTG
ncbi:MAG: hypothetical protein LBD79_00305 [Treponema sp.]|jgi:hypothetical protein|nr:hypothetical protein [Treponema sp.]